MSAWRPPLPREHGSWAMWLVPALAAAAIASRGFVPVVLFLVVALSLFLARYPITLWMRGTALDPAQKLWLAMCLLVGVGLGALLLLRYDRWWLLPLGLLATLWLAVHLALARAHRERSVAGQWVGVVGLVLAGPATYYVATGHLDSTALALGVLSTLYFGYPIYYVKFKVDPATRKGDSPSLGLKLRRGRQVLLYQALSLAIVAGLTAVGVAPWAALVAFVPATAQVLIGVLRPSPQLRMKRLGFTQVGHSIAFGILLALAFRLLPT